MLDYLISEKKKPARTLCGLQKSSTGYRVVERNNRKSNKTDLNAAVLLFLQCTTAAFIPAKKLPFYLVDLFY